MTAHLVTVRHEDETGSRRAAIIVEAETSDEAAERGLEFARNQVFFGAKAEYVEWMEAWPIQLPYVMRVDPRRPKKGKKKKRSTANRSAVK